MTFKNNSCIEQILKKKKKKEFPQGRKLNH